MENIGSETKTENTANNVLSQSEKEMKILLSFAYLKSEIENNLSDPKSKNAKNILKYLKQFETELEDNIDTKVSTKDKKIFIELKNAKFDENFLKLSKFI